MINLIYFFSDLNMEVTYRKHCQLNSTEIKLKLTTHTVDHTDIRTQVLCPDGNAIPDTDLGEQFWPNREFLRGKSVCLKWPKKNMIITVDNSCYIQVLNFFSSLQIVFSKAIVGHIFSTMQKMNLAPQITLFQIPNTWVL